MSDLSLNRFAPFSAARNSRFSSLRFSKHDMQMQRPENKRWHQLQSKSRALAPVQAQYN